MQTITDAKTIVGNSGVLDWDWGSGRDPEAVLEQLTKYVYQNGDESTDQLTNDLLVGFIRDVLGDDPVDYSLQVIPNEAGID